MESDILDLETSLTRSVQVKCSSALIEKLWVIKSAHDSADFYGDRAMPIIDHDVAYSGRIIGDLPKFCWNF
jgi:hypothetical protein